MKQTKKTAHRADKEKYGRLLQCQGGVNIMLVEKDFTKIWKIAANYSDRNEVGEEFIAFANRMVGFFKKITYSHMFYEYSALLGINDKEEITELLNDYSFESDDTDWNVDEYNMLHIDFDTLSEFDIWLRRKYKGNILKAQQRRRNSKYNDDMQSGCSALLKTMPTEKLVEELATRKNVQTYPVGSDKKIKVKVRGAAVVLVIAE